MNIKDYQIGVLRTANMDLTQDDTIMNGILGLNGEAGEIADYYKKHLFQGHELDLEKIAYELGDVAWYLALLSWAIGYDLDKVLEMNAEKLRKRYGDGFDKKKSINRQEEG